MSVAEKDLFQLFEEQKQKVKKLEDENYKLKQGAVVYHKPCIQIVRMDEYGLFPYPIDPMYTLYIEEEAPFCQDEVFKRFKKLVELQFDQFQKDYEDIHKRCIMKKVEAEQNKEHVVQVNEFKKEISERHSTTTLVISVLLSFVITSLLFSVFS